MEGNYRQFALFYFVFESNFRVQAPPPPRRGLYLEGWFDGGRFALRVWEDLYLEGYYVVMLGEVFIIIFKSVKENVCEGSKYQKVAYFMKQESKL